MFNSLQENVLIEFLTHTFSLSDIELHHQPIALSIGGEKTLLIEAYDASIRLSILIELDECLLEASIINLLTLCHYNSQHPLCLKPGFLQKNRLTLSAYIMDQDLSLPDLSRSLDALNTAIDKATGVDI